MLVARKRVGMSLRFPSEIVVERFVPTARAMLAAELDERGLTQQEIAGHLGVTQAAVSKYASGDVAVEERFVEDERMVETVDRLADGFADETIDGVDALAELLALVRAFEDRGPICAVHEEEMPALKGLGCDLCVRGTDPTLRAERDAIDATKRAARLLAATPGMAAHVPNVGTNVGTALPDPKDVTDVAAIPGRIYEMNGRVEVPAAPEFGASRHVAGAILAANAVDAGIRGALNLATSESLLRAARELGYEPMEFDPDYEDRRVHLRARFEDRGGVPTVCYHAGAFGIEPVTYVYGETATEAATIAARLVDGDR